MVDSSGGGRGGGAGRDAGSKAAVASQAQSFYSVGKYEKALECLQRLATQMVRWEWMDGRCETTCMYLLLWVGRLID